MKKVSSSVSASHLQLVLSFVSPASLSCRHRWRAVRRKRYGGGWGWSPPRPALSWTCRRRATSRNPCPCPTRTPWTPSSLCSRVTSQTQHHCECRREERRSSDDAWLVWLYNPFTAPACKISALKSARVHACKQYIWWSCNKSTFHTVHFDRISFTCSCEVVEKPEWFQIWHFCWSFSEWQSGKHGSERVKLKLYIYILFKAKLLARTEIPGGGGRGEEGDCT